MKQDWHHDELAQHWTISNEERDLLGNRTGATRLSFAILLKSFQAEGRFPDEGEKIAASVVNHLAIQTGVPDTLLNGSVAKFESERTDDLDPFFVTQPSALGTEP